MTDELKTTVVEGTEAVTPAPETKAPETGTTQAVASGPELTPEESLAYAQGWRPKEEFQGNPDEWRPAKEWRERGELLQKVRRMGKEMEDMKSGYKELYNLHLRGIQEANVAAIERLKAQRREAIRNEELELADKIEDKIDEIKDQTKQVQLNARENKQQVQSTEFEEWIQHNQWYQTDEELSTYADAVALRMLQKAPGGKIPPDELGEKVALAVRKQFPDKFKRPQAPPAPEVGGSQRGRGTTTGANKFADVEKGMTQTELQIMDNYVNKLKIMSKEEYMKGYVEASARGR
jgi:hypothetical protein